MLQASAKRGRGLGTRETRIVVPQAALLAISDAPLACFAPMTSKENVVSEQTALRSTIETVADVQKHRRQASPTSRPILRPFWEFSGNHAISAKNAVIQRLSTFIHKMTTVVHISVDNFVDNCG